MSKGLQRSYVNAGGLFFFEGGVPSAFEEDVLACNLLFQLGASVKHDKFAEGLAWRQFYLSSMSKFGHDLLRRNVVSIPVTGENCVWSLVKSELSKGVSLQLIQQAERTLMQLQKYDSAASQVLKANASRCTLTDDPVCVPPAIQAQSIVHKPNDVPRASSAVSLQLGFVDKEPVLTQVFVSFKARCPLAEQTTLHLLTHENIEGYLELMTVTTELDNDRYAVIKEDIQRKLGVRRSELIRLIDEAQS